jgi:hypothetical protein
MESMKPIGLALVVATLVASVACRQDSPPPEPNGQFSMALTGTAAGVTYRLRNARFVTTALSNGAQTTLESESDPDGAVLSAMLAVGAYSVTLENGWALERVDTAQVVDATLTSPNTRMFQILAGSTTTLSYAFSTSGGPIIIGPGTLNVRITVDFNDGGAPDGGAAGCTTTPNSCGAGFVCQPFDDGTGGTVGMCVRTCDPVTQQRSDGAPACGSASPTSPNLGCYGRDGVFTCLPVSAATATRTHGSTPLGPAGGGAFINGCAPGYQSWFFAGSGSSTPACQAYCQPGVTFQGNGSTGGGLAPHTCVARGATAAECRFLSWVDSGPTSVSNGIGVCFDRQDFNYDHDLNPTTPNVACPSCTALSSSDLDANGTPDYLEWGCGPLP